MILMYVWLIFKSRSH